MIQLTFEQLRKHFQQRRLKFTSQRHAIYRVLASSVAHPSVEELYSTVKRSHPMMSMNTVYNTLDTLNKIVIASEISLWHDKARFDANRTTHHHLVCLHCKKIENLYDNVLDQLALSPKAKHQYRIVGYRVEFHGYCSDCKTKKEERIRKRTTRNQKAAKRLLLVVSTIGITALGLT
jgi:Fur family peroxide stress response transcriptional regulator